MTKILRNFRAKCTNGGGFTLAELLIVVAVIAVLVALAIPTFNTQLEKSRQAVDVSNLRGAYAAARVAETNGGVDARKFVDETTNTAKLDALAYGYTVGTDGTETIPTPTPSPNPTNAIENVLVYWYDPGTGNLVRPSTMTEKATALNKDLRGKATSNEVVTDTSGFPNQGGKRIIYQDTFMRQIADSGTITYHAGTIDRAIRVVFAPVAGQYELMEIRYAEAIDHPLVNKPDPTALTAKLKEGKVADKDDLITGTQETALATNYIVPDNWDINDSAGGLTYSLTGTTYGLVINGDTGEISGTIATGTDATKKNDGNALDTPKDPYNLSVKVIDKNGKSCTITIKLDVKSKT